MKINDPEARLRQGLTELYAYYSLHEQGMWKILRDLEDMPELRPFAARRLAHRQRVREVLAAAWSDRRRRQRLLVAAFAHAVDFFAWRSLRQGLSNEAAVELMVTLAGAIAQSRQ